MKQIKISNDEYLGLVSDLCRSITLTRFKPDYVVGITRGGLIPATCISQYLNVRMYTLQVSFRDGTQDCESNLWMAEEAFGYERIERSPGLDVKTYTNNRKNILIVDDINDTGKTLNWIKDDWQGSLKAIKTSNAWDDVWHHNVKFATLIDNQASKFKNVDYTAKEINKKDDPSWIVFPWEEWWK